MYACNYSLDGWFNSCMGLAPSEIEVFGFRWNEFGDAQNVGRWEVTVKVQNFLRETFPAVVDDFGNLMRVE